MGARSLGWGWGWGRWGWAAALALHGALAVWLFAHPVSLPSDDALFFALGIERFSVLEFRPHFPGYPAFVLIGKGFASFTATPETALFGLSATAALLIPPATALLARTAGGSGEAVLAAYAIALTQPLLPLLGLSMMSDGTGILFLLLGLAALAAGQWRTAGVLLAVCLVCRPSLLVPVAAAALWALGAKPGRALHALILGGLVCLAFVGGLVVLEGVLYFEEALRFLEGHFLVWGNTVAAERADEGRWIETLAELPLLWPVLGLSVVGFGFSAARKGVSVLFFLTLVATVAWTVPFQNPDNLRHLAPVLVLSGIPVALAAGRIGRTVVLALVVVQLGVMLPLLTKEPVPSPLARTLEFLQAQPPGVVITNHGVHLARRFLEGHRVVDAAYPGSVTFARCAEGTGRPWRVTALRPGETAEEVASLIVGRVFGEKTFKVKVIAKGCGPMAGR